MKWNDDYWTKSLLEISNKLYTKHVNEIFTSFSYNSNLEILVANIENPARKTNENGIIF